jgi:hypothetical protein
MVLERLFGKSEHLLWVFECLSVFGAHCSGSALVGLAGLLLAVFLTSLLPYLLAP